MKKVSSLVELTTFLNLFITADDKLDCVGIRTIGEMDKVIRAIIPDFLEKGMKFNWQGQKILFYAPEKGDKVPLLGTIEWKLNKESELGTIKEFKFIK